MGDRTQSPCVKCGGFDWYIRPDGQFRFNGMMGRAHIKPEGATGVRQCRACIREKERARRVG